MYISTESSFELDKIIKSFEVAYRSHIANKLKAQFPTEALFKAAVESADNAINASSIVLTHKYKAKIAKIKRNISENYEKIENCNDAYLIGDFDHDVPNVSEIIDYVNIFYNECFSNLSNGFATIEDFMSFNSSYQSARNSLSHPASSKISTENCKRTLSFIKRCFSNISDDYFWYVSKPTIQNQIDLLVKKIDYVALEFDNLSEIPFSHQKIVQRESELTQLSELIFGKETGYRRAGSVAVYGYGGIGKTALLLEFLFRTEKEIRDNPADNDLDFILFFSAKEELLSFNETSKKLYIKEIQKQITSFAHFEEVLSEITGNCGYDEFITKKGIIAIDNFETLKEPDKEQFFEYIRKLPRGIQFIITSRNEEQCEAKISLREYTNDPKGIAFIDEYTEALNLKHQLTDDEKIRLLDLSKGNTLIIVLSLQLISDNYSIENTFTDLENVSSANIEVISDFMYKNTIGTSIQYLQNLNHDPTEILKVISLYDIPVDIYSLSKISNVTIQSTERICEYLSTKLVLEKIGETFKTNDFANKFIVSKFLPSRVEQRSLKERIREHQRELNNKLDTLEITRKKNPLLNDIMNDWKPVNSIDKIAISEAFSLYGQSRAVFSNKRTIQLELITSSFEKLEKMTSHPYIRVQRARCFQELLKAPAHTRKHINVAQIKNTVCFYYEEAIEITNFYYPSIKKSKSYASINWLYGMFLDTMMQDPDKAVRYLEDSVTLCQELGFRDDVFFPAIKGLSYVYAKLYDRDKNNLYLSELSKLIELVIINKSHSHPKFDFNKYLHRFGKYRR